MNWNETKKETVSGGNEGAPVIWFLMNETSEKLEESAAHKPRETADVIRRIKCYMEVGEVIWQWTSRAELYWTYTYSDQSHSIPPLKMNFEIIQKEKWNLKRIFWEMWKKKLHICVTSPYFQRKVTFKTRPECFCFASMSFLTGWWWWQGDNLHSNQSKFMVTRLLQIADWWIGYSANRHFIAEERQRQKT